MLRRAPAAIALGRDSLAAELFPPGVLTASAPICGTLEDLLPEERALVARAVPKRQREFATGRLLARHLLAELGVQDFPLSRDSERVPIWPEGIVGSISHTDGLCVAAVARQRDFAGLGVDVERDSPLEPELWDRLFTSCEQEWLGHQDPAPRGRHAKLLFVAKEAAYKCVFPDRRQPLGFQDVVITVDGRRSRLVAAIEGEGLLQGLFRFSGGSVGGAFTAGPDSSRREATRPLA